MTHEEGENGDDDYSHSGKGSVSETKMVWIRKGRTHVQVRCPPVTLASVEPPRIQFRIKNPIIVVRFRTLGMIAPKYLAKLQSPYSDRRFEPTQSCIVLGTFVEDPTLVPRWRWKETDSEGCPIDRMETGFTDKREERNI